jgi:hypothetical protein
VTIGTISIYKLECLEQTGPGEDQIWMDISGTREWPKTATQESGKESFAYRRPGPSLEDVWEMSDEEGEQRVVKEITVFEATLHTEESVQLVLILREGTSGNNQDDETPGSIKCFLKSENGRITVRGETNGYKTVGGQCVTGDSEFPQMQRFDLKNDDGHYLIFLRSPGYCP